MSPSAADDHLTTVEDYSRFLIAVMDDSLLSKDVFEEMKTNQVETKKINISGLVLKYMRWETGKLPFHTVVPIKE